MLAHARHHRRCRCLPIFDDVRALHVGVHAVVVRSGSDHCGGSALPTRALLHQRRSGAVCSGHVWFKHGPHVCIVHQHLQLHGRHVLPCRVERRAHCWLCELPCWRVLHRW